MGSIPQYILDALGGSIDENQYYWNPDNQSLVDRYTGGSYGMSHVPDPSLGTDVVTNLSEYNQTGQAQQHFAEGEQPFFGFPDYGGTFISADPNEINEWQHDQNTRVGQGALSVGALVGGAALGGALGGGGAAGGDALTGVTVPSAGQYINNAIPFTAGVPAASAFGTGAITSAAAGAAANAAARAGAGSVPLNEVPGMGDPTGGGMPTGLSGLLGGLGDWAPLLGGILGAVDAHNQPDSMTQSTGGTSTSTYGTQVDPRLQAGGDALLTHLHNIFNAGNGYQAAGADPLIGQAMSRLQNLGSNPFASGGLNNTAPTASGFASGQINNTAPTSSAFATGARANTSPTMSGFATGQYNNTAPTASSFAGGQGINPYLDQVFNAAADSTQNRLGTEFAHAGGGALNSGSHQQARSQELQNLAAGIYAPGYEAERNRMYGAQESSLDRLLAQTDSNLSRQYGAQESGLSRLLSQSEGNLGRELTASESGLNRLLSQTDSNLARQYGAQESSIDRLLAQMEGNLGRQYGATEGNLSRDLASISPMLQGGDYLRQIQQQQLNQPMDNYAQYAAALQGLLPFFPGTQTQSTNQTGSVTQPLFNNPLAGFFGGAQLGQSLFGG